jgi:hypothetical protein
MATQGTEKILGGTPYKRYPDPIVKGTPNEYGLYPWSTFRARFMLIDNNGYVAPAQSATCSEALLFTSDIPAIVTVPFNISLENNLTSNILSPTVGGTPGVTVSAFGQVAIGYAGANYKVRCSGFTVNNAFSTISLNDTNLDCIANGSVICSPIGRNNYATGSSITAADKRGTNPIILRAYDYTQAMYDNGNIISEVFPFGPSGYNGSWIVVGLWLPS